MTATITAKEYHAAQNEKISEAILHKRVAEFLDVVLQPPVIWTTLGHGGGGKVRGAQLKAMGLKPGWPDILIIAPGPNVLGIELKRPGKGARQSPEQAEVQEAFFGCKAWYCLCTSVESVGKALDFIRVPRVTGTLIEIEKVTT